MTPKPENADDVIFALARSWASNDGALAAFEDLANDVRREYIEDAKNTYWSYHKQGLYIGMPAVAS